MTMTTTMSGALREHQLEIAALAQRQDVLVSAAQRIGKTFTVAHVLREHLQLAAATASANTTTPPRTLALAVAATQHERAALYREIVRACGVPVLLCGDPEPAATDAQPDTAALPQQQPSKPSTITTTILNKWTSDLDWTTQQFADCVVRHGQVVAVLSPATLLLLLRKHVVRIDTVVAIAIEETEQVQMDAPAFYRALIEQLETLPEPVRPRIVATTRARASSLDLSAASRNALYARIRILSVVPLLSPAQLAAPPTFPPLLCEPFDASATSRETGAAADRYAIAVDMRSFLTGENHKKLDFLRVFRMELEMGNSAAVYDERKRQDKINRFVQDAESVYNHLGYWCLLKFIELELQANLQACLVDDDQNVNHCKKRQQAAAATTASALDEETEEGELVESDKGEDNADEDDDDMASPAGQENASTKATQALDDLSALVSSKLDLDDATRAKVSPILNVIAWLSCQTTAKISVDVASPRLRKTAQVVRSQLLSAGARKRVWVFLERRSHCRVVADYLTAFLRDLTLPPCCCMLGTSHARVSGSLHFSSNLKVMAMFKSCATNVMVTTSIAKKSKKVRVDPPQCDLVVVMDELLEADKLFEFAKRAHPATGVVKYVTPSAPADIKKFHALVKKMHEFVLLDEEQSAAQVLSQSTTAAAVTDPSTALSAEVSAMLDPNQPMRDTQGRIHVVPRVTPAPVNPFEIVNRDTGAILNASNAVACLSKFCDSLPGLDTYDKRPQYIVKRHPLSSGMSLATKQYKKKRLKYNAKIHDKIDDCRAEAEAKLELMATTTTTVEAVDNRFEFAATLKLPLSLGIKRKLASHKVPTPEEAKGIVAFKACQELIKKGLLDRHFRSKLIEDQTATIHCDSNGATSAASDEALDAAVPDDTIIIDADDDVSDPKKLKDLSTQNSYDLPPVSAAELSLRPIRTLLKETQATSDGASNGSVTMCCYGLTGVRYAILATNELYTGNTNTGWRYDFATSDVMEANIHPVTLAKTPVRVQLTKQELESALHFHLVIMRLACMGVQDAMRDVDIAGDDVWKEFSEQNDKGYLVVPSMVVVDDATNAFAIDWSYVHDILGKPLIEPIWPFPDASVYPHDEWICVPTFRRNVTYVVQGVSTQTAKDTKAAFADKDAWDKHIKEAKSTSGNPILGRWHTAEQILQAQDDQPLIYGIQVPPIVPIIRRVMQRNNAEGSIAMSSTKFNERLLLPEFTSRLRLTKTRYFEAIGIVPVLYEFERKCQMSNLMNHIGLELDISLLDDATSKPAYERLEILGDTFLKLETTWFMYENRQDITQEGELTRLRRDIIRNDRLNEFALAARLHHYILYPAQIEQHPFECWKPSCMGKTPKAIVAPSKWIADVLEAICGAYVVGQGEKGARYFLKWIGVSVMDAPFTFARPFYPDCFPCELYDDDFMAGDSSDPRALDFAIARFDDLPQRLVWLQQRLKYTFRNKRLLLEAVTHPSAGHLELQPRTESGVLSKEYWRGDYERLEYLGDAIIEYLTLSYAFLRYDSWLPGSLSQWKSATVSNDALGKTALACFGIDECICVGAVRMDHETMDVVARIERTYARTDNGASSTSYSAIPVAPSRKKAKATGANPMALPKMFADVFEALVAAVFLDSGNDLQTTRDVFLGPLLDTVGKDALAYVCHASGLTIEQFDDDASGANDQDAIMESLFSDDDDE